MGNMEVLKEVLTSMLRNLDKFLSTALTNMQNSLLSNPHLASQIQAKIVMLRSPTLANEIVNSRYYTHIVVNSTNGRRIPIVIVFPQATMRTEASQAAQTIQSTLPFLENFMATPFPVDYVSIWYGFIIGSSGGGGTLNMEDQGTYNTRITSSMPPYEAGLDHELSHNYIAHESLTHFLEIYAYNLVHTNSTNMQSWTYTWNYTTWSGVKTGYAALLDVYGLIGRDAMANAYRTIYPLHPPYGQPLPVSCKQAFIDQTPFALKSRVGQIVANITY